MEYRVDFQLSRFNFLSQDCSQDWQFLVDLTKWYLSAWKTDHLMFSVDGAFLCISPALKNPSQDFRCYFWFGFVFLAMSELIFSIFNLVKQQCELVPLDQMNENYETQLKCLCFTKLFASNFLKYYREIFFIGKYFNLFFHFISYSFCKRGFWVQCNACRLFSHFSGEDILSGCWFLWLSVFQSINVASRPHC